MTLRKLTILCLAFIILSACGTFPQKTAANHEDADGVVVPDVPAGENDNSNGENHATDPGDNDTATNEDSASNEPEEPPVEEEPVQDNPRTVEKIYYMNKIYDIKPIHEGTEDKVVLLTFDDGPKDYEMVTSMLETLKKHDAKAIFFVNGFRVKAKPDLLQLIHEEGHAIGNHSWDHINLRLESDEKIRQQVDDVQTIVEETIGIRPQFFRPPHGASNEYLREYVKKQGMLFMTWSNGSLDWDRDHQTPEAVVRNVLDQLRPGSNILMHELPWTVEALDELLTRLTEEGYRFVDPHTIQIEDPTEAGS